MKLVQTCVRRRGSSGGFIMIIVMMVALIGILFGVGRLLAFRFQCEKRLDRQDELNRIMATRSAMQYVKSSQPVTNTSFRFVPHNGMNIGITVARVKPVDLFYFQNNGSMQAYDVQANCRPCTYFGVQNATSPPCGTITAFSPGMNMTMDEGLVIGTNVPSGATSTFGVEWTGSTELDVSWVSDVYGRRYSFWPEKLVDDCLIRLVLVAKDTGGGPMGTNDLNTGSAIALEQAYNINGGSNITLTLKYRQHGAAWTNVGSNSVLGVNHETHEKGMQIAGTKITMSYYNLQDLTVFDGVQYDLPSWTTNEFRKMRMYVEVVKNAVSTNSIAFRELRVDRSYEYACILSWYSRKQNISTSEVSTVMHFTPGNPLYGTVNRVYTYDTHGTTAK